MTGEKRGKGERGEVEKKYGRGKGRKGGKWWKGRGRVCPLASTPTSASVKLYETAHRAPLLDIATSASLLSRTQLKAHHWYSTTSPLRARLSCKPYYCCNSWYHHF